MKRITIALIALIINVFAFGQVPNAFQYQSIIRDASNNVISNQNVNLKILILDNSPTGSVLYTETHSVITNEFGLINQLQLTEPAPVANTGRNTNNGSSNRGGRY
jgi:hypothetical protein